MFHFTWILSHRPTDYAFPHAPEQTGESHEAAAHRFKHSGRRVGESGTDARDRGALGRGATGHRGDIPRSRGTGAASSVTEIAGPRRRARGGTQYGSTGAILSGRRGG